MRGVTDMKFYKREDACGCEYCEYYIKVEYYNDYFLIQRGICRKNDILRKPKSELCDFFILKSGVYTSKWYPNKDKK